MQAAGLRDQYELQTWSQCTLQLQEALEAEAERDMGGLGRSISSMSFGSGEREQMAHQLSGHAGSSPLRATLHSVLGLCA